MINLVKPEKIKIKLEMRIKAFTMTHMATEIHNFKFGWSSIKTFLDERVKLSLFDYQFCIPNASTILLELIILNMVVILSPSPIELVTKNLDLH